MLIDQFSTRGRCRSLFFYFQAVFFINLTPFQVLWLTTHGKWAPKHPCVYLGVCKCQLSLLKPEAQSYGPVLTNGSPGNSVQCVNQKRWGSGEGRSLWPNTDVLPAELDKGLNWKQMIIKIIILGSITLVHWLHWWTYLNLPVSIYPSEQLYLIITLVVIFFLKHWRLQYSEWFVEHFIRVPTAALWCV